MISNRIYPDSCLFQLYMIYWVLLEHQSSQPTFATTESNFSQGCCRSTPVLPSQFLPLGNLAEGGFQSDPKWLAACFNTCFLLDYLPHPCFYFWWSEHLCRLETLRRHTRTIDGWYYDPQVQGTPWIEISFLYWKMSCTPHFQWPLVPSNKRHHSLSVDVPQHPEK